MQGQRDNVGNCSFSYDGQQWMEACAAGASAVGPLAHEPGWDFYEVACRPRRCAGPPMIHVRRAAPIRLVRIYAHWPSSESPLATSLHPGGVKAAEVELPASVRKLLRILVAVCPPIAAMKGNMATPTADFELPRWSAPTRLSAAVAAAAAAEAEAEAADAELRATRFLRRPRSLKLCRRLSSSGAASPASSDVVSTSSGSTIQTSSSCSSRTPRGASDSALESQRFQEEMQAAVKAWEAGDCGGDTDLKAEVEALRQELFEERAARRQAEEEAASAALDASRLRQECTDLLQRLRTAERATMASEMQVRQLLSSRNEPDQAARRCSDPQSLEEVVSALVNVEVRQLNLCAAEDRAAAKRKLLLKWHPDKNSGSGGCSDLAKRMVQEMQSHPEWK